MLNDATCFKAVYIVCGYTDLRAGMDRLVAFIEAQTGNRPYVVDDQPIDLNEHGDTFFLIKEFQAPPESVCGLDEVKRILRTYVPDAFMYSKNTEPIICCPRCGCQEYTLLNRGYSIFTGFLGSGKVKRVCNRCKKEF